MRNAVLAAGLVQPRRMRTMPQACKAYAPAETSANAAPAEIDAGYSGTYVRGMDRSALRALVFILLNSVPMLARAALVVLLLIAAPAAAVERTFVFSPADLVAIVDAFNGDVLAHSASFGGQVRIGPNGVRFFGRGCASLHDGVSGISRVRILDGAGRAAQLASRRPNLQLGLALQSMGAKVWASPATARTVRASWVSDPSTTGAVGFVTTGFANRDASAAIRESASSDIVPAFLAQVDLLSEVGTGPVSLAVALTTDTPPARFGGRLKRSECFAVVSTYPADVKALRDLLAATSMPDATRVRLSGLLDDAVSYVAANDGKRAARTAKRFAQLVAENVGSGIAADDAEPMITRGLLVSDALGL